MTVCILRIKSLLKRGMAFAGMAPANRTPLNGVTAGEHCSEGKLTYYFISPLSGVVNREGPSDDGWAMIGYYKYTINITIFNTLLPLFFATFA